MSQSSNKDPVTREAAAKIAWNCAQKAIKDHDQLQANAIISALNRIADAIDAIPSALLAFVNSPDQATKATMQTLLPIVPVLPHSIDFFVEWAEKNRQLLLAEMNKTGKFSLTMKQWRAIYEVIFPLNESDKALDSYSRPVWHRAMKCSIYRRNGPFRNFGRDLWGLQ